MAFKINKKNENLMNISWNGDIELSKNEIEKSLKELFLKVASEVMIKIITCKNADLGEINKIVSMVSKFINNETQVELEIGVDENFETCKKNLIIEIITWKYLNTRPILTQGWDKIKTEDKKKENYV